MFRFLGGFIGDIFNMIGMWITIIIVAFIAISILSFINWLLSLYAGKDPKEEAKENRELDPIMDFVPEAKNESNNL